MRFELSTDQKDFAASLESLLAAADTAGAARAWAVGDHEPGLALWSRLAQQGVTVGEGEPEVLAAAPDRDDVLTDEGGDEAFRGLAALEINPPRDIENQFNLEVDVFT